MNQSFQTNGLLIYISQALLLLLSAGGLNACRQHAARESSQRLSGIPENHRVTASGTEATDPYLMRDHLGNAVLCWTEKHAPSGQYLLKYAVFDTAAASFTATRIVTPSLGTKTSAESANKVAFKSDGTVVALFGKRFDHPQNRFAGAIQYCFSTDQGTSWSAPRYLHSDTLHKHGRGFFDMARLTDGELGAVWLDGRYSESDTGSALFFARTTPGGGFGMDEMIGQSTCECCRTDILVDSAGTIHLAYRDILYPPGRMGRQVRDMVYSRSRDNGRSFLPPIRISEDNWEIEGCPHAGPSLAAVSGAIHALWFTAGSGSRLAAGHHASGSPAQGVTEGTGPPASASPGVYEAALNMNGSDFSPRKLLSPQARHPQLTGLPGGGTALAWDETITSKGSRKSENQPASKARHREQGGHNEHAAKTQHREQDGHGEHAATVSAIVIQLRSPAGNTETVRLTNGERSASHPVLMAPAPGQLLVAWVELENGIPGIRYSFIEL